MKKKMMTVGVFVFITAFTIAAKAQDGQPCKRIEKLQGWMKDSLSLTADQASRIAVINDSACAKLQRLKTGDAADKQAKRGQAREIMENSRNEYKKVLTEAQMQKLQAHIKEMRKNNKPDPAQRSERMTQKMKSALSLTDDQTQKVKEANHELAARMKVLKEKKNSGADKAELKSTMKLIRSEYDAKIKAILTTEQLAKWEKMKAEHKDKRQHKKGKK